MTVQILQGDCRTILPTLPAESVDCIVTSPPYFGLRDYGVGGQIGLEATPDAYVKELVGVFRECRRVLKNSGTLWLNLGDSYAGSGKGGQSEEKRSEHWQPEYGNKGKRYGLKPKDLIGIPWLVAFALRADGWYLRSDIIWSKPNPMPESVTDRPTKAHEYLFLLSKSGRYYFDGDAVREDAEYGRRSNFRGGGHYLNQGNAPDNSGRTGPTTTTFGADPEAGRNIRSVWTVATAPFSEAHFATFPPDLIEPCIKAGCPLHTCAKCGAPWIREIEFGEYDKPTTRGQQEWTKVTGQRDSAGGLPQRERKLRWTVPSCECDWAYTAPAGVVLDPFGGAGTTALVADRLGRNAILIELNPDYAAMSDRRLRGDAGMFASVERQPSLLDEAAA